MTFARHTTVAATEGWAVRMVSTTRAPAPLARRYTQQAVIAYEELRDRYAEWEPEIVKIVVDAGSDPLRVRRYTRDLGSVLRGDPGLLRQGISVEAASDPIGPDGAKGTAENLALLATAATSARPAFDMLITAIQTWCSRPDRRATVTVVDGDRSLTLVGDPGEEQQRLIREFLDAPANDGSP